MAWQVFDFAVILPTGTSPTNLSTPQPMSMTGLIVRSIHMRVPPGPRGEVGFYIGASGNQVFPLTPGSFIITDNEIIDWTIENTIDTGAWQLVGYNTGSYPHTIYVRFLGDPVTSIPAPTVLVTLPSPLLTGSVTTP